MALVFGGVAAGIVVSFSVGRALGLGVHLAALVAIGNSICGNSAIAALAPVIGAEKKDVASAIGLTAVIGVLLVLGLPMLITPFLLSNYQYGVLAGMSVYAVPQVVAAAFPVSELSGNVATLVKLTRVLLLGPAVVIIGLAFRVWGARTGAASAKLSTYVPWFVAVFLVLAAVRSLDLMPVMFVDPAKQISRLLTMLAMAGLGFGVDVKAVRTVGPRVGVAVVISLLFLASITVAALKFGGIDG
ncbi:MAG: putative sulfate exporter family transporter [Proteobacteria bacterium]|nr:putative sulfate exporter family transporter [Pseudomonadota bacterium]